MNECAIIKYMDLYKWHTEIICKGYMITINIDLVIALCNGCNVLKMIKFQDLYDWNLKIVMIEIIKKIGKPQMFFTFNKRYGETIHGKFKIPVQAYSELSKWKLQGK